MDELDALKQIDAAFSSLDEAAQGRVVDWLVAKYSVKSVAARPNSSGAEAHTPAVSLTAKAVATALNAQSGPELLYAAAAFLGVVQKTEIFSRQALLDAMKSATGFYKPTFNNNLSSYLDGLCKRGVLIEVSPNTYSIKAATFAQMSERLAAAV